jgi:uncharacterized protein (UPF0548 family)
MLPLPWPLLRRRAIDPARWRAARISATPDMAVAWREDRFDGVAAGAGADGFGRVRDAMLAYAFFPPSRLTGVVATGDGRMVPGATIVQRVRVGPVGFESGARVVGLADGVDEAGRRFIRFSYATLEGHPEQGIATYAAQETGAGDVRVLVVTRSRASAWWARLGWPVTRRIQLRTNRAVVERLVALALDPAPGA